MKKLDNFLNKNRVITGRLLLPLFLALVPSFSVEALTIVRMEMRLATTIANVDMELYDEDVPLTVSNFLGYVNRGDYDNSFYHRSVPGFVVQGGGFTYVPEFDFDARFFAIFGGTNLVVAGDPDTGELGVRPIGEEYVLDANNNDLPDTDGIDDTVGNILIEVNDGLQTVPVDGATLPLLNEPGISNLRGTLAMAKFGNDPDSAANEWFVNVSDNSLNLDAQNGGFTVFGSIMGSGMDYFDAVNGQSAHSFGTVIDPAFTSLPVINADGTFHTGDGLVLDEHLAKINVANEVLHIDVTNIEFGNVAIGQESQRTIVVTNKWFNPVTVGDFGDLDLLSAPYSVVTDNCSGAVIQPAATCDVVLGLNVAAPGLYLDSVDFSFVTPDISNISIELSGLHSTGANPDINVDRLVDFGGDLSGTSDVLTELLVVTNIGESPLTISSVTPPSGVDALNFTMTHDCVDLTLGASCVVTLKFDAIAGGGLGDKVAEITINTNDPDASAVVVSLLGFGGDGNNDNVLDSVQSNVVSLQTAESGFVTLVVSDDGFHQLSNVSEVANPSPSDAPNVVFDNGFISYDVDAAFLGDIGDVGIILPVGSNVNTYYQYGVTPGNNVPHWYEFLFDGQTGAQVFKNITLTAPDSSEIQRDMILIRYEDGARGDNDLTANGTISMLGASGRKKISSDSSGQTGVFIMLIMIASIIAFRRRSIS